MTKVKCNAKTCGYNSSCDCTKRFIDVEGLFAKSKIGTFCQSFKNPHNNEGLKQEMAKEMSCDSTIKVSCSANYCVFNQDDYCHKDEITIGNENAQYRSETQCDSFKLKS